MKIASIETPQLNEIEIPSYKSYEITEAFAELKQGVCSALETYSNVHRGSGHNSKVSTYLFEQARDIVLDYLGLNKDKYMVIFCTPRRAKVLMAQLKPSSYQSFSSQDIGLSLGIRAIAVKRNALPKGIPFETGGGTARLVSPDWVIWSKNPDKFEAGTPSIINIIAFAKALRLIQHFGNGAFQGANVEKLSVSEILYCDELEKLSGKELLHELRKTLIGLGVSVPTMEGVKPFINLDNGASTPTFTPIWDVVQRVWRQTGQVQQEIIQEVKSICSEVLGAPLTSYDVIFTSNTTEAINLVSESLCIKSEPDIESVILNTLLEHNSNELPWRMTPGLSLIRLSTDAEGFVDFNEMENLLCDYNQKEKYGKKRIKLVAVSGASNVLGVFNNLVDISRIAHQYGARLLVDAAQLVAHRKVEMDGCGIDYLAFAAHKVYAPFGTGVLLARKEVLNFSTSEMELIQSSGEENVGGIAALGKTLVLLHRIGFDLIQEEEQALTRQVLRGMAQIPGLTIYGLKDPESPRFDQKGGVIVFGMQGIMANQVAKKLAERGGIGVRYGCHCAHLLIKRLLNVPPLLALFQGLIVTLFPRMSLPGLTRVSLGIENSKEEVDTFIQVLGKIAKQPRNKASITNETPLLPKKEINKQIDDFVSAVAQRVYSFIITGIFLCWFLIHSIIVTIDGLADNTTKSDCILILGNKVNMDGTLSERLKSRVEQGLLLYQQKFATKIVVSGGHGKEGYDEGTVMKEYLVQKGVPDSAIIADNTGTNTFETAKNFKKIARGHKFSSVIVVSQFYHLTRTKFILREIGINNVNTSHSRYFELRDVYSLIREFFGYYKYWIT
jgi:selenocysteine lyase/cysteine desulfurase/vancomycin permeability regulator SanA